jgi:hypothetical protein
MMFEIRNPTNGIAVRRANWSASVADELRERVRRLRPGRMALVDGA